MKISPEYELVYPNNKNFRIPSIYLIRLKFRSDPKKTAIRKGCLVFAILAIGHAAAYLLDVLQLR